MANEKNDRPVFELPEDDAVLQPAQKETPQADPGIIAEDLVRDKNLPEEPEEDGGFEMPASSDPAATPESALEDALRDMGVTTYSKGDETVDTGPTKSVVQEPLLPDWFTKYLKIKILLPLTMGIGIVATIYGWLPPFWSIKAPAVAWVVILLGAWFNFWRHDFGNGKTGDCRVPKGKILDICLRNPDRKTGVRCRYREGQHCIQMRNPEGKYGPTSDQRRKSVQKAAAHAKKVQQAAGQKGAPNPKRSTKK